MTYETKTTQGMSVIHMLDATSCNSRDKINLPFIIKVVSQSIDYNSD